ncbi:MAG: hypothetical protein Q8S17_06110 [Humidesulfovibrio sp.]|nr:hypothetical protein [Humidesulfovibrio sp.]
MPESAPPSHRHIQIDPARSDRDGLCTKQCPANLKAFSPDGLPQGHRVPGALMAGHPRHGFKRLPLRKAARMRWL